ncbi:MAG: RNA polymerase sigma factor [Bacillota bacterium]|nr:sigma-70 family RNA polymerase sigma factor [Bacillota bacterium]
MYSDQELVAKTLKGHKSAFDELVERYAKKVYNLSLRMTRDPADAEDLTQEVFLRAYRSLNTYNPAYSFVNWILKIASNLCIDHLRRKGDVRDDSDELLSLEVQKTYPDPESAALYSEQVSEIEKALMSLPPKYQLVMLLLYAEDLKYEQIAEILDEPIGTVKTKIHRARKILKERFFSEREKDTKKA